MIIENKLIKYNFSTGRKKVEYIVIHTTGNPEVGAGINNHFNYFNGGNRQASADFFVEGGRVAQFVADNNYSWHCGDGGGKYGITNSNSIGIEICVNKDGDYDKTIKTTVELVKYLMNKYNLPISRVVQHYDASRKNCPREIREGKNGITWDKFKKMCVDVSSPSIQKPSNTKNLWEVSVSGEIVKELQKTLNVKVDGYFGDDTLKKCPILKINSKSDTVKAMQKRLNQLGYNTNGIDGIFGNATLKAIKDVQSKAKITVDGIVGNNTWKSLYRK